MLLDDTDRGGLGDCRGVFSCSSFFVHLKSLTVTLYRIPDKVVFCSWGCYFWFQV